MSYQQPFCRTEKYHQEFSNARFVLQSQSSSSVYIYPFSGSNQVIIFLQMKIYEQVTQWLAWAEILSIPLKQDLIRNENTTNQYQCFSFKNA